MRVLVDVNVFLDVLTRRRDWVSSLQVLHLLRHVPALEGWTHCCKGHWEEGFTLCLLYAATRR